LPRRAGPFPSLSFPPSVFLGVKTPGGGFRLHGGSPKHSVPVDPPFTLGKGGGAEASFTSLSVIRPYFLVGWFLRSETLAVSCVLLRFRLRDGL